MSNSSISPGQEGEDPPFTRGEDKEKPTVVQPEFVLIDERAEEGRYTFFGVDSVKKKLDSHEMMGEELKSASPQGALALRLICFFCLILAILFGLFMTLISIFGTLCALLSLFQNQALNRDVKDNWKTCLHTLIACFGLTLGILSPTLGLGMLALYFSLVGKLANDSVLRSVIRGAFNNF